MRMESDFIRIRDLDILYEVKKQLAYEFNRAQDDFSKDENTITTPILHEKRRKFSDDLFFIQMATFGKGMVLGVRIIEPPTKRPWGAVNMSFYDPDNNVIYFRQLQEE
ncbi:MAG: hypothetical protein K5678_06730 [Acetatifactor sp.]|nr:hypothetical protein [Acetatifactor sp.]